MSLKTWSLLSDTTTAGAAVDLGNGADQHAPIGLWSGYVYRHFAKYNVDTSGMASISAATLHIRATTQVHVGFGSSPSVVASRLTSAFIGSGGSEGSWSGSANPKDSTQPLATATGQTTTSMTRTENAWDTLDVTAIAQAWLAGSANYGIRLRAASEASGNDTWEAYAQASAYDSYITVTYIATGTAHPPVAVPLAPLTGDLGDMSYAGGSGWVSPRPTVQWSFSDPDSGGAQSAYQVIVYGDAFGSPGTTLYDSGKVASRAASLTIPATFTEGGYYHWQVQVWDNTDLVSAAYTATQRFRTRWGAAEYYGDLGAVPAAWALTSLVTTGRVTVEYNSATDSADPGGSLDTWSADLASVTRLRYLRYRVWLLPALGLVPTLDKIAFSYSTVVAQPPDAWTLSAHAVADTATQVYGVRSLRIDAAAADERSYQLVTVLPDTDYYLSGQIKQSVVGVNPFIALSTVPTGATGEVAVAPGSTLDTDWHEVHVAWNSGAATNVYIQCGASGTGSAWFDALKLEASDTVTPWMPSVIGPASAIDGSGVKIDGSTGGTMRLRGTTGGLRDIIELGAHGLKFGGDANLSSPAAGILQIDGTLRLGSAAGKFMQSGTSSVVIPASLNGAGTTAVTFSPAFDNTPIVMVSVLTSGQIVASVVTPTASGFTCQASRKDQSAAGVTASVSWIAIDVAKIV